MNGRMQTKSIPNGKSATFPVTGTISAEYHTPGAEIKGLNVPHNEKVVTIDQILISHAFIADIDEAMNHYDSRSIYSTEMGRALAYKRDVNVIIEGIKGARASALVTGGKGGSQIKDDKFKLGGTGGSTTVKDKAAALASGLFSAAQTLAEKNVPLEGAYALFRPSDYYCLVQNTDLINSLWGGAGAYSDGKIFKVAGIEIVMTNNVPSTDTTQTNDANYNEYHNADCSKTIALVGVPSAIATVNLMDLFMRSSYDERRLGTLLVSGYSCGHSFLRPEGLVELCLNTLTND